MKSLVVYCVLALSLLLGMFAGSVVASELELGDTAVEFPQGASWFGGERLSLEQNKGEKVTLLYFMKPGCGSCDKFAPHLYRLLLKHRGELSVVGVTEFPDDKIYEYLQKRIGDYPIMQDLSRSFMQQYIGGIDKYPYIAVINKEGILTWFGRGKFHAQVTEEVERALGSTDATTCEPSPPAQQSAMVVGADYSSLLLSQLPEPVTNAELVAKTFTDCGYADVELLSGTGATKESFVAGIEKLGAEAAEGDTAVLYFSGDAKPNPLGSGGMDLKLYLADATVSLRDMVGLFTTASNSKNLLVVIDANSEKSSLPIWEDIADDVGKAFPGTTIILSAARWDRSMLSAEKNLSNFSKFFAQALSESTLQTDPYSLWRMIRDEMSRWSRVHKVLQSPFIVNPQCFSIGKVD